jgi:hypothetical protein
MNYQTTHEEVRALRSYRERIADLLSRYPRVSAHETGEILTFLRTGRHLDIGMLTSNERLRPQLDAFMADHRSHFRVKWGEGSAVIGGIVALLLIFWLVWEAFS